MKVFNADATAHRSFYGSLLSGPVTAEKLQRTWTLQFAFLLYDVKQEPALARRWPLHGWPRVPVPEFLFPFDPFIASEGRVQPSKPHNHPHAAQISGSHWPGDQFDPTGLRSRFHRPCFSGIQGCKQLSALLLGCLVCSSSQFNNFDLKFQIATRSGAYLKRTVLCRPQVKPAFRRGAQIIPVMRTGGASSGLFQFPQVTRRQTGRPRQKTEDGGGGTQCRPRRSPWVPKKSWLSATKNKDATSSSWHLL